MSETPLESSVLSKASKPGLHCSFQYVLPVRFALCTNSPNTIPENISVYYTGENSQRVKTGKGILPAFKHHHYTLRTLDQGYLFVAWEADAPGNENKIKIFYVNNGLLYPLNNGSCQGRLLKIPLDVPEVYMLFVRSIELVDDIFMDDSVKMCLQAEENSQQLLYSELHKNIVADPYGYMQPIKLGKPEGDSYSYTDSKNAFPYTEAHLHVEEFSSKPGSLVSLRYRVPDIAHFYDPDLAWDETCYGEILQHSPQDGEDGWYASFVPFRKAVDIDQVSCSSAHVACLADPQGLVFDLVAAYNKSMQDIALHTQWHVPFMLSGSLNELYLQNCKTRGLPIKETYNVQSYRNLKKSLEKEQKELFKQLHMFLDDWQSALDNGVAPYNFKFLLKTVFAAEDQQEPASLSSIPELSQQRKAHVLTSARLHILGVGFAYMVTSPASYEVVDRLFAPGSDFSDFFSEIVGKGALPASEYGLMLSQVKAYIETRRKFQETRPLADQMLKPFYRRLGLSDMWENPTQAVSPGIAATFIHCGADFPPYDSPVQAERQNRGDKPPLATATPVTDTSGPDVLSWPLLSRMEQALLSPSEHFFSVHFKEMNQKLAALLNARAELKAESQLAAPRLAELEQKVRKAEAEFNQAVRTYFTLAGWKEARVPRVGEPDVLRRTDMGTLKAVRQELETAAAAPPETQAAHQQRLRENARTRQALAGDWLPANTIGKTEAGALETFSDSALLSSELPSPLQNSPYLKLLHQLDVAVAGINLVAAGMEVGEALRKEEPDALTKAVANAVASALVMTDVAFTKWLGKKLPSLLSKSLNGVALLLTSALDFAAAFEYLSNKDYDAFFVDVVSVSLMTGCGLGLIAAPQTMGVSLLVCLLIGTGIGIAGHFIAAPLLKDTPLESAAKTNFFHESPYYNLLTIPLGDYKKQEKKWKDCWNEIQQRFKSLCSPHIDIVKHNKQVILKLKVLTPLPGSVAELAIRADARDNSLHTRKIADLDGSHLLVPPKLVDSEGILDVELALNIPKILFEGRNILDSNSFTPVCQVLLTVEAFQLHPYGIALSGRLTDKVIYVRTWQFIQSYDSPAEIDILDVEIRHALDL